LGLEAFDSLKAEQESWLLDCFVPPPDFELMASGRSAVIIGDVGSGKSAVAMALAHQAQERYLVAFWQPTPSVGDLTPWRDARSQFEQVIEAIGLSLVRWLAEDPQRYRQAMGSVQTIFRWFVRRALLGSTTERAMLLAAEISPEGEALLKEVLAQETPSITSPDTPVTQIVSLLVHALRRVNMAGAWIIADGLGAQWAVAPDEVERSVRAFLSTLPVFELAGCTYKIMAPIELQEVIFESEAVSRARLDSYWLRWITDEGGPSEEPSAEATRLLRDIIDRRFALALGYEQFSLSALCEAPGLWQWLHRVGGDSPRGWLATVHPLIAVYLSRPAAERRPLSVKEWKIIRRRQLPRILLDEAERSVTVGWHTIRGLSDTEWNILCYLYQQRGRAVPREDLYQALFPASPGSLSPLHYRGIVDTALWRLRKAIEPVPGEPMLIITERNQGIRLNAP